MANSSGLFTLQLSFLPCSPRIDGAEEGYGVLDMTWTAAANADHLAQLQALATATTGP